MAKGKTNAKTEDKDATGKAQVAAPPADTLADGEAGDSAPFLMDLDQFRDAAEEFTEYGPDGLFAALQAAGSVASPYPGELDFSWLADNGEDLRSYSVLAAHFIQQNPGQATPEVLRIHLSRSHGAIFIVQGARAELAWKVFISIIEAHQRWLEADAEAAQRAGTRTAGASPFRTGGQLKQTGSTAANGVVTRG